MGVRKIGDMGLFRTNPVFFENGRKAARSNRERWCQIRFDYFTAKWLSFKRFPSNQSFFWTTFLYHHFLQTIIFAVEWLINSVITYVSFCETEKSNIFNRYQNASIWRRRRILDTTNNRTLVLRKFSKLIKSQWNKKWEKTPLGYAVWKNKLKCVDAISSFLGVNLFLVVCYQPFPTLSSSISFFFL